MQACNEVEPVMCDKLCVFVCVRMQRGQIKGREYYQAGLDSTQVADLGGLVEAVPKSTASYSVLAQLDKHKSCPRSSSNITTELRLPSG